jgi:hypothetical protein
MFNLTRIKVNADEGLPSVNVPDLTYTKNAGHLWGRSSKGAEVSSPCEDSTE